MNSLIHTNQFVTQHFYNPPGKIGLLYGDSSIYPTTTIVASEIIRRNGRVVFVDAANRVDPYYLARLARYQNIDPNIVLNKAYVARAFTFYQVDVTITDGLLEFIQSVHASSVIVLGLLDLIDDEQVPVRDVYDILQRVQATFKILAANGISTLMVSKVPHFQLQDRNSLFSILQQNADIIYRTEVLEEPSRHVLVEEGKSNGKNNTNSDHAHPAGRCKLVTIPPGAQKRGSRYF